MRTFVGAIALVIVVGWTAEAQVVGIGAGVGYVQLGGLQELLGTDQPFALSGSAFLDFTLGPTNVRLLGNLALVEGFLFTTFETDLFWNFPLGRVAGFLGAGTGLVGLPSALSPTLSFSLQVLAGLQTELLDFALVKVTAQAMKFYVLNAGFLPGAPLVRLEIGIAFPLRV